jgi:uncharacterized protein YggT (Ycf19 family)
MGLINIILNLAGLLLWLGWRDAMADPLPSAVESPLARTLRRAGYSRWEKWRNLWSLAGLLLGRTLIYWWVGPAVGWTPKLQLDVVVIPFRSEFFGRMILFSLASFGATLAAFYLILLFFSLVNHRLPDGDPLQKFVRNHLGKIDRWPKPVKLALPFLVMLALWFGLHWPLVRWDIIPPASSVGAMFWQSVLISADACLVWRHAAAAVLLLHFLNSYVYFGNHPVWTFVNATAQRLLAPLRRFPLQAGRIDFTPVLGMALVYLVAELLARWLPRIYPA